MNNNFKYITRKTKRTENEENNMNNIKKKNSMGVLRKNIDIYNMPNSNNIY